MSTMAGSQAENPKSVFKRVIALQLARAAAQDAADAAWEAEADRILRRMYRELEGSDTLERMFALMAAKLPPKPPGFSDRRNRCNRCGQTSEYCLESDASFCPRCRRWLERRCGDPMCQFCSQRPERPSAVEGRGVGVRLRGP